MVTIVESNCPGCNKKVDAIDFEYHIRRYINEEDRFKTTLRMLGCPECNNLFYKKAD